MSHLVPYPCSNQRSLPLPDDNSRKRLGRVRHNEVCKFFTCHCGHGAELRDVILFLC